MTTEDGPCDFGMLVDGRGGVSAMVGDVRGGTQYLFAYDAGDGVHVALLLKGGGEDRRATPKDWKKHVRNLFWGNGTENTARRVSSRQL